MSDMRERRALYPIDGHHFNVPPINLRKDIVRWISTNTSGQFYLCGGWVTFAEEADALMFMLSKYYAQHRELAAFRKENDTAHLTLEQIRERVHDVCKRT